MGTTPTTPNANAFESQQASTSMIAMTQSVITGGVFEFNQTNVHRSKSPMESLQEQVAQSAFHNSAQRIDAPRCHPNTRVVVKEKGYRWIMRSDTQSMNASILWLNGAAGGGKSAIAQSLAERCYEDNLLLASFFFSRSDPSRNHAKHLIATIVYQIYQVMPPHTQELIHRAIEQDPLIWSRDIFTQFRVLIVDPISQLKVSGYFQDIHAPRVIIIDGLDECVDRMIQRKILEVILKAFCDWHLPFLFFISSRPEPEIKAVFERPQMLSIAFSIPLNDDYLPDVDIELFLRDKFQECRTIHPLRRHIPPEWPPQSAITTLVRKSSGQFIYASVVVEYVTSIRHYPHRRLEVILDLRPTTDSPFAELDAVYSQILSGVEDLSTVQRIISFRVLFPAFGVEEIETILNMEDGELPLAMSDMASLICILPEEHSRPGGNLHILHASFEDFIFDTSRSKHHCVDRTASYYMFTKTLISCIMDADIEDSRSFAMSWNILSGLTDCFCAVDLDSDITQYIVTTFSISTLYNRVRKPISNFNLKDWPQYSLPRIFDALDHSISSGATTIRQHLLDDFDKLLSYHLNLYPQTIRFNFNVALISLVQTPDLIPRGAFYEALQLDHENLDDAEAERPILADNSPFLAEGTIKMISDYLCTPSRSHSHTVGPETFSEAAIYCLRYLCHHGAPAQMNIPVMSYRQRSIRRMYPWKWNQRFIFEEVRGPGVTPWMWLSWPWERKTVLEPYRYDIIYAHLPLNDWATPMRDSPVVYYRMRSERYWLALHYLTQFLPAAGDSDTLVKMCRTKVFASKSQGFPRKSRRARAAMREYLERWGHALY
ncbi:hypothetical protein D9619_007605 [Psilocybe cf. subviscida]|uniref:Nephrocystin 3-like N-terminal domain-containing protein n=1 Tax=Psilocybe cf. subviscida TaxID=2480587 RepID=A0A8H5B1R7_9AGAR|nr:hypothetical protein D9619_007605 [Psilocybe cf. subviscida]